MLNPLILQEDGFDLNDIRIFNQWSNDKLRDEIEKGNITKDLFLWAFGSLLNETKIIDLSPPSQVHHTPVLATAGVYSVLFLVGMCGNVSMLTILAHLIYHSRKISSVPLDTTFFYIIALSFMDLLVILSLPLTISDMLLGHWIFGSNVCKMHWTMESIGKIMSTAVLTLMSFDRYMGVCFPMRAGRKSLRTSSVTLVLLVGSALALLLPLPWYADAREMASIIPSVQYTFGVWARFITVKCRLVGMSARLSVAFTWYIFVLGFVSPAILIGFFYSQMLWKIREHRQSSVQTSIPVGRIVFYTLAICAFYFLCWTPYWAGVLYANFSPAALTDSDSSGSNNHYVYLMYLIHALPIINSSFNWIFYAQLNTQLRRKREEISRFTRALANSRKGAEQAARVGDTTAAALLLTAATNSSFVTTSTKREKGDKGKGKGKSEQAPLLTGSTLVKRTNGVPTTTISINNRSEGIRRLLKGYDLWNLRVQSFQSALEQSGVGVDPDGTNSAGPVSTAFSSNADTLL